ncbi:GDSL-type esterase/lipase family protein [Novosphingobium naphthalenivorans]|uniref:GDSL-type esterase/lipase family protein n=1 Tax=Novosphingobium naphthalenivorans TaxID=273168 RepID=UPI000A04CC83|nr:GDSL-type esterase/lipase family protein [Novosphingobium naphthalenivorans]
MGRAVPGRTETRYRKAVGKMAGILAAAAVLAASPVAGAAAENGGAFDGEMNLFAMEDESVPKPPCSTLFVGSSSIRFWFEINEDMHMPLIKRGFGGATIPDVNRYFNRIVTPYRPSRIVFYAGENDLDAGHSPAQVLADFKAFLDRKSALLGDTPVFFVSVKPSPSRWKEIEVQRAFNALVGNLAKTRSDLVYIDVATPMLRSGTPDPAMFISDHLHMKRAGYAIWKQVIGQALQEAAVPLAPDCRPTEPALPAASGQSQSLRW